MLIAEAKLIDISDIIKTDNMHPLSIAYDEIQKRKPYALRVHGALISLIFFDNIEKGNTNYLSSLTKEYEAALISDFKELKKLGIEANQIFLLMFFESINQSIVSDAGSSFEKRIKDILISEGISKDEIYKIHDLSDKSIEFDLYFKYKGKTYGIGAKRTLRERYKQFSKKPKDLDIMIEITLGFDLTKEKATNISNDKVIIFIADEIYNTRTYLQEMKNIYPSSKFNLETLRQLI